MIAAPRLDIAVVSRALARVQAWVERQEYRGYEPFDGLSSWARPLVRGTLLGERMLQQIVRQCPVNLRPVLGVRPDKTVQITVTVTDQASQSTTAAAPVVFVTPPLPAGFPPLHLDISDPARMEPGVTMFGPGAVGGQPGVNLTPLIMVDEQGEVVWYYNTTFSISDARRLSNGNLLFMGASAIHENHFTLRRVRASTIGARISTPPRIRSASSTALAPNVYASVVVAMIPAAHSPDRKVSRVGAGSRPSRVGRTACRHRPELNRNRYAVTVDAIAVGGSVIYFEPADCVSAPAAWITIGEQESTPEREAFRDFFRDLAGCAETSMPGAPEGCVDYDGCDPQTPVTFCSHPAGHEWPAIGVDATKAFFEQFYAP